MDKRFCVNCGAAFTGNEMFCGNCGAQAFAQSETTEKETVNEYTENAYTFTPPAKKNRKSLIALLISISAVMLVTLTVSALWMFTDVLQGDLSKTPQQEEQAPSKDITTEANAAATKLSMQISQFDNSAFPDVTIYSRIQDENGNKLENIDKQYFLVKELGDGGKEYVALINEILPIEQSDTMNINLVLDRSGSMDDAGKMQNAKNAVGQFVDEILQNTNNYVEVTTFDTYVYNTQPFTNDKSTLHSAVNSIYTGNQTALFDAVYDALISTNGRNGSRFVIAFTDGQENASLHTSEDVIQLSAMTGIPVYLIGIGNDTDYTTVSALAKACNGEYFNVGTTNLRDVLQQIYAEVYQTQRNMYKIRYTSTYTDNLRSYRTVRLEASGDIFSGKAELAYMPKDSVVRIDNAKLTSIIAKYNTSENVAVAIVDLNTSLEYRVGSVRNTFVASGFYAPVYIVAHNANQAKAEQMMEGMNNDAGNQLMAAFGGLSSVNTALTGAGFTQTTFARNFGDIAASDRGYENYTSALDSAKILRELYNIGGHTKMIWDLTKDGITVPYGAEIYSHRGQGIGGAYNAFAIIISGDVKYGIAIMTMHPGKTDAQAKAIAVPMISEIMGEVHNVMVNSL